MPLVRDQAAAQGYGSGLANELAEHPQGRKKTIFMFGLLSLYHTANKEFLIVGLDIIHKLTNALILHPHIPLHIQPVHPGTFHFLHSSLHQRIIFNSNGK